MGHKPVRCVYCGTPISKNFLGTKSVWIHYPTRKGVYKGGRFFGCQYYDPTIPYSPSDTEHNKQATPPKEILNAKPTL